MPDGDGPPQKYKHLSTGAVVGIGLGASVAGAGLVTISVYLFARRRLYKKQQKRWQEQMMVRGLQPSPEPGAGGPGGGMAMAQGPDGKPAMVVLARQGHWRNESSSSSDTAAMLPPLRTAAMGKGAASGSDRPSPASSWAKELGGWEPSPTASSQYSTGPEARRPSEGSVGVNVGPSPATDRGGRTATWLGRHSIYEMP